MLANPFLEALVADILYKASAALNLNQSGSNSQLSLEEPSNSQLSPADHEVPIFRDEPERAQGNDLCNDCSACKLLAFFRTICVIVAKGSFAIQKKPQKIAWLGILTQEQHKGQEK